MHVQSPFQVASDLAILDMLTAPSAPDTNTTKAAFRRRDAELDPLMLAAIAASGPQITRNHYTHDFFPAVSNPKAEGAYDWTRWKGDDSETVHERQRLTYVSRQAPRRQRLGLEGASSDEVKENLPARDSVPLQSLENAPASKKRRASVSVTSEATVATKTVPDVAPVEVKCMARTRIPTPHGPAFLHIYHNNKDKKEHMAIVVDSAQWSDPSESVAPAIRSRSLDAVWDENETEMDRITRGAYVGRLSAASQHASKPISTAQKPIDTYNVPPPLIRIHSECFTGETVGSLRCDCGEQLDEAIRQISQPLRVSPTKTIPGRGAVIYLRQEGRGIGLLSKIRAYNLQDLGHDTVTANLMLGHGADERAYDIAGAILRDLQLGTDDSSVRILTNNPDKVQALKEEGVTVSERVPMVPRSWQCKHATIKTEVDPEEGIRPVGATLIGGGAVYGEDLDKYLRTKVLRMGHMLSLSD